MIEFKLKDWRENCSILGLINILEHFNGDYKFTQDGKGIIIEESVLDGFEEKYFKYFIDRYEKDLPWYRIASYKDKLNKLNPKNIEEEEFNMLNAQIDLVKDYMTRPNYTKIYEFIDDGIDMEGKVKSLKKINLRKNEEIEDRIEDIESQIQLLKEITEYSATNKARKYMGAKGVIYSHIDRGIGGVSFLNQQTKEKDIYKDYREYFIEPLKKYLNEKNEKGYECFQCGSIIRTVGDSSNMNLINETGFDETRKSSYAYEHISDIMICRKCLFLYTMLPAGFNYSLHEGVFINLNRNMEGLIMANKNARNILEDKREINRAVSYRTIVNSLKVVNRKSIGYGKEEIQVVRQKNEKYFFDSYSKDIMEVIIKSEKELEAIENAGYRIGRNDYFSIYDLVMERIFNNQNLFTLIHYLLVNGISNSISLKPYYSTYHILKILNINIYTLGGMDLEKENNMKRQIYDSWHSGNDLKKAYINKDGNKEKKGVYEKKLVGITYKLLNALKSGDRHEFMDNLIRIYARVEPDIPFNLVDSLGNEEEFKTIGYAFIMGLNGTKDRR